MAKMDKSFSSKGSLYKGEDGRYWILETTKSGEEKVPFEDYLEQFLDLESVSFNIKESKKIKSHKK